MSFWKKIQPRRGEPTPEALEELKRSQQQLARAESRDDYVQRISAWLEARNSQNHFGDAVDITFTPRRRHHA